MSTSSDTASSTTHVAASLAQVKALADGCKTRNDEPWEIIGGGECLNPFGIEVGAGAWGPYLPLPAALFIVKAREAAPKMATALESVLSIHSSNGAADRADRRCTQCGELFPCRTVRVITDAFNE